MKNDGKLKTENNLYNEAYDDVTFLCSLKRQAREFNLSLFHNDRSSIFSKIVCETDIVVTHTGT